MIIIPSFAPKSIHFNKQLVKRLFTLIMTAAKTCATLTTYCINFINENNTRSIFLRVFK